MTLNILSTARPPIVPIPTIILKGSTSTLILGVDFQAKFGMRITDRLRESELFNFSTSTNIKVVRTGPDVVLPDVSKESTQVEAPAQMT